MADQRRTVGVEEEFLLVDGEGRPGAAGDRVVARGRVTLPDPDGIEHELQQEQAESGTAPHRDLGDVLADLGSRRRTLNRAAEPFGLRLAAVGTSPVPVDPTPTRDPRYQRLIESYGPTASRQLSCGCHVHVGIADREEGVRALDGIQPWLPVLVALSANSPFWVGEDTGYASYRRQVWGRWPGSGPTAPFGSAREYDDTVRALVRSGVLLDEAMVYFDVRLSAKFPTVEVRVADVCPEPEDAVLLAALVRALVDTCAADPDDRPPPRPELLTGASWLASRHGLDGALLDPWAGSAHPAVEMVHRMVDRVGDSLRRHGDETRVDDALKRLLARGTGSRLQRESHARRGSLADVALDAAALTAP